MYQTLEWQNMACQQMICILWMMFDFLSVILKFAYWLKLIYDDADDRCFKWVCIIAYPMSFSETGDAFSWDAERENNAEI